MAESLLKDLLDKSFPILALFAGMLAAGFAALVVFALGINHLREDKKETEKELKQLQRSIRRSKVSIQLAVENFKAEEASLATRAQLELKNFIDSLSENARKHLLDLNDKIDNISRIIHFDEFLDRVKDSNEEPPIYDFYRKRTEEQRQQIFLEEPRILAFSLLALAENSNQFSNIFWLLGVFYASSTYLNGDYIDGPNLRRGIVYLRRAMEIDPHNEQPVDDLGAVLISITGNQDQDKCLQDAINYLTALQQQRTASGRPTLQRAACNLAWGHLAVGRLHPLQLPDSIERALSVVSDDDLLSHPFRVPGRSDPGIVRTTRACILAQKSTLYQAGHKRSALLEEATVDLEAAEANPVPSVQRVILEETNRERGDLMPLMASEFAPRVKALCDRLRKLPPQ